MKLGLLSDSHDHHQHLEMAMALFRERGVDHLLHAGDYVNPGSVRLMQGFKVSGVLGNNDGDLLQLAKAYDSIKGELMGEFGTLTLMEKQIALYHGTQKGLKEALIASSTYDILVFGHTHQVDNRQVGRSLVLNPGTVHGFYKMASIMILDLTTLGVEVVQIAP
ncbi:MAG: metallophosphoesterase [Magnetococcales bacterium]|nr:metallophosphoesterase [Magnetococcales bacterium]NGZ27183.1 metallophosphoesterase [Magnetococcales bacterium]